MSVLDSYAQPSIEVLNIRIDEPITTLTDLLLAAVCIYAFRRIARLDAHSKEQKYFQYYFLFLALAAASGGLLGHAFLYRIAEGWKLVSWTLTIASVALIANALIILAKPLLKPRFTTWISYFNMLFFLIALFFTYRSMVFIPVIYYLTFGMVVIVGSLCYFLYRKTESRGMLLILGAVGIGIFATIIASLELGLNPWFNHNDISHIILTVTAFGIYKGAVLIVDRTLVSS